MDTALLLYLYVVFDNVAGVCNAIITFSLIAMAINIIVFLIVWGEDGTEDATKVLEKSKKLWKKIRLFPIFIASLLFITLYPDKEDLALIFGGTALVHVAQTEEAQKLPDNLLKAANAFLEGVYEEEE